MDQDRFATQQDAGRAAAEQSRTSGRARFLFSSSDEKYSDQKFRVSQTESPQANEVLVSKWENGVEGARTTNAAEKARRAAAHPSSFASAEEAGRHAAELSQSDGRDRHVLHSPAAGDKPYRIDTQASVTSDSAEHSGETTVASYRNGKQLPPAPTKSPETPEQRQQRGEEARQAALRTDA